MMKAVAVDASKEMTTVIRRYVLQPEAQKNLTILRNELLQVNGEFQDLWFPMMSEAVEVSYGLGSGGTDLTLDEYGFQTSGPSGFAGAFSKTDRDAMKAILNDNFSDLAGQTNRMQRRAVGILRTEAGYLITKGLAQGKNPRAVAKELENALERKGFISSKELDKLYKARTAAGHPESGKKPIRAVTSENQIVGYIAEHGYLSFIDRAGREWDLAEYCYMAAQTKMAIAQNEGAVNRMNSRGINHYIVSSHNTVSEPCIPHEGNIYWTGEGESNGYSEAGTLPPYQPRCSHYVMPYVETGA
jgi:hypothetical protein